uniref:Plastid lipid-associated protein/fibrillin conserved domain-containing protein n=1 Tax=Fagus sylvatica TaxID=28930 RepID=A0A2N9GM75_FAGSY
MALAAHSSALSPPSFRASHHSKPKLLNSRSNPPLIVSLPYYHHRHHKPLTISASVSVSNPEVRTGPDDLVASLLSKVTQTDGGVLLSTEEHEEVAAVVEELQEYCVNEPVKCPLIFGEWDVVYCSRPTSPGGGYRSALGRLFFKTKEMIQDVEVPNTVRNKVSLLLFGFMQAEVSLKGTLKALDDKWIQVVFEPPELKIGPILEFQYGGQSEVKLQITYIDDKIRLGKGSRGSLFVFQRRS